MSRHGSREKSSALADNVKDMKIESSDMSHYKITTQHAAVTDLKMEDTASSSSSTSSPTKSSAKSAFNSSTKRSSTPHSPAVKLENEEIVGGDITVKLETGQPPKLSRAASRRIIARPPTLYLELPDATPEAVASFDRIPQCTYGNKYLGSTDHALECDCSEEWGELLPLHRISRKL